MLLAEAPGPHTQAARRDDEPRRGSWCVLRIDAELARRDLPEALRRIREAF
jgi:hypothetical protein